MSTLAPVRSSGASACLDGRRPPTSLQHRDGLVEGRVSRRTYHGREDLLSGEFLGIRRASRLAASARWIRSKQAQMAAGRRSMVAHRICRRARAYVALRLAGTYDADHMRRAAGFVRRRRRDRAHPRVHPVWLALFDLWLGHSCPCSRRRSLFLPTWGRLNLSRFAVGPARHRGPQRGGAYRPVPGSISVSTVRTAIHLGRQRSRRRRFGGDTASRSPQPHASRRPGPGRPRQQARPLASWPSLPGTGPPPTCVRAQTVRCSVGRRSRGGTVDRGAARRRTDRGRHQPPWVYSAHRPFPCRAIRSSTQNSDARRHRRLDGSRLEGEPVAIEACNLRSGTRRWP